MLLADRRCILLNFTSIYAEFYPKIYRYLSHFVGNINAPDLTQAVFLKVGQSLDSFRGECSLATWIYRIATNTAYDHTLSSQEKQRKVELFFDDTTVADTLLNTAMPEIEYIRREMNDCIRGLVDQLPENYRTVLLLSEFEEFTNPEIAEILCLSVDTVKIRLHRARAKLREAMEYHCNFYHDERNELMCDRKT